jgi:ribosomal protein L7Ae-like RNA K-turn-binding protein
MNKIDNMLGFAVKSNNITIGYKLTKKAVNFKKINLVIVAKDISDSIRKKLDKLLEHENLYYIEYKNKDYLGKIVGKKQVGVIGIKDGNMTDYIIDLINQEVSYEDIRIIKNTKCTK